MPELRTLSLWLAVLLTCILLGCGPTAGPTGGSGATTSEKSAVKAQGGPDLKGISGAVKVDGSSTVFPVTEAVAEDFGIATEGKVQVTVGISGTGGGFKKFLRKEIDIADASRPILEQELTEARKENIEFFELPVCFDALTVVVNPANDWVDHFTVEELKKIWAPGPDGVGMVTTWDQVRSGWPKEKIVLFGAGSDSGTFDYFTEAIVGKAKSSRSDYTGSEDDNVLVKGVSGNKFALGYIPFAYYEPNKEKLKGVSIDWEKDELGPIVPNLDNVLAGKYNPLSRPLFLYVNREATSRPEVKAFVEFYLANVSTLAKEVQYLPLPESAYTLVHKRFLAGKVGTVYGGKPEVGVTIDSLLQRESQP